MIPIGRGQRELIIGDRQTGKTSIAIDTDHQPTQQLRSRKSGLLHLCSNRTEGFYRRLACQHVARKRRDGLYDRCQRDSIRSRQPCNISLLLRVPPSVNISRDSGRHALVVYDDLSKQAVAYREVSLILRRPSGREAYPGDIFYLHSRLLERAAKIINQPEVAGR